MTSTAPVPDSRSLSRLAAAARECRACELYENAEQVVFGAGPRQAHVVLVGEQPGDVEDQQGKPFVGPAGRMLDRALVDAGLPREDTYVTNAVKHFRWKPAPRGKRRIHQTPAASHVTACRPWLVAELNAVRPTVVVALGATAASSLYGPKFRLTQHRGETLPWPPPDGPFSASELDIQAAFATIHPSAVLRGDDTQRRELYAGLVADLSVVAAGL
jgi:uracil-DNA glycosylase